ncbi:MAG: hypothetical protein HYS12_24145 [Planctomycetes bacterium]|nr:hypothetical protein [Planctomycetota bacterium]
MMPFQVATVLGFTLQKPSYEGDPDKRLLDPACGSGTFLVMAINRIRKWYEDNRENCPYDEGDLCGKILANVIGFDLNPLAVMAARTNYLSAIRPLVSHADKVEIPVYLCDSIMTPSEYGDLFSGGPGKSKALKTAAATFVIPTEIATKREDVAKYAEQLEFCVRNGYSADEFLSRCRDEGLPADAESIHTGLYNELVELDKANKNGVWARIIKNAFAPLFVGKVDYVAGNPPWVNWESLPKEYRDSAGKVWEKYALSAAASGVQFELGKQKRDIAILFVYVSADTYLRKEGTLGFVITQTLFKTRGAEVFRRFDLGGGRYIRPMRVSDLSKLQVFEGATNRTAVLVARPSTRPPSYPVPYVSWDGPRRVDTDASPESVREAYSQRPLHAYPIDPNDLASPWLCGDKKFLEVVRKVIGASPYQASAGCCTWLNGVYWVTPISGQTGNEVVVQNLHEVGKKKLESVTAHVESRLLYPLLRGRDVKKWATHPSLWILYPHTEESGWRPIDPNEMKRRFPLAYAYLKRFESQLLSRSGYRQLRQGQAFYILGNTNAVNFSKWKVAWRDMGYEIQAGVSSVHQGRPVIPEHHVMFVPLRDEQEAHYLCGMLNSLLCRAVVAAYTITTGISTHVLQHVAVPRYKASNKIHARIAKAARACQYAALTEDAESLAALEEAIDNGAAQLWGVEKEQLQLVAKSLTAMISQGK